MIATFVIALREFLEAFLIAGVFLGISRKLNLKKEKEILLSIFIGTVISLLLPIFSFYFSDLTRHYLDEKTAEIIEGYLSVFSGLFLAYVVFSLHKVIRLNSAKTILQAHKKLTDNIFDFSLFFTIVFLIVREGFEIALFTATISLFTDFIRNLYGLFLGFITAFVLSTLTFFSFVKLSLGKIFKFTEFLIILLGAALVKNGINELLEGYLSKELSDFLHIKLIFLPDSHSFLGYFLKSFTGLERDFSLLALFIMLAYIFLIYSFFKKSAI